MSTDQREILELTLRELLREAETVIVSSPLDFCRETLKAISIFLASWEELEEDHAINHGDDGTERNISRDLIRSSMCKVQRILGPGHDDLRDHVISLLRSVETRECRTFVLEFLPMAIPRINSQMKSANSSNSRHRKARKELFAAVKEILLDDDGLLTDVFNAISHLVEFSVLSSNDAVQFVLELLPKCPEDHLHVAIRTLIRYSDIDSNALDVVDGIRTELALVQKAEISDMLSVVSVFDESINSHRNVIFVEQYIARCEEVLGVVDKVMANDSKDNEQHLSIFDTAFVLLARGNNQHCERIDTLFSDFMTKRPTALLHLSPEKFFEVVRHEESMPYSASLSRLIESYLDVAFALLVSSHGFRDEQHLQARAFQSQRFMAIAVAAAPSKFQKKAVHKLAVLLQQTAKAPDINMVKKNEALESRGMRRRMCHGILSVFLNISEKDAAILADSRQLFINLTKSDDCLSGDPRYMESLCKLISILSDLSQSQLAAKNDLVLLCQSLLVAGSAQGLSSTNGASSISRTICGLKLAKEIVGRCDFDSRLSTIIGGLALRILRTDCLDPCVGVEAVEVIHALHCQKELNKFDGKTAIDQVLARLRLVQYPKNQKRASEIRGVTVRFADTPTFLLHQPKSVSKGKALEMVFCFDFLTESEQQSLVYPCKWIYTLLKTYLTIGRPKRWVPQAWTDAGIEFPSFPAGILKTYDKSQRLPTWFDHCFGEYQSERLPSAPIEIFFDEIVQSKKSSERKVFVEYLQRLTHSLLLGISLSAAILSNVYDFFENNLLEEGNESRIEAVKLLQRQFVKMYAMRQICQSLSSFFLVISKKRRKMGRGLKGKGSLNEDAGSAAAQIYETLHFFFSSTKSSPIEAVWIALTDPHHDSIIVSSFDPVARTEVQTRNLLCIMQMRLDLISHLCCLLGCLTSQGRNDKDFKMNAGARRRAAQCLRVALFISHRLPILKKSKCDKNEIQLYTDVSTGYFQLLQSLVTLTCAGDEDTDAGPRDSDLVFLFDLYSSLMGSQDPMKDAIYLRGNETRICAGDFKKLAVSCQEHLQTCSAAVAIKILDTLCVFAISMTQSDSKALHSMIELSWEAMKFQFNTKLSTIRLVEIPFALTKLLERTFSRMHPASMDERTMVKDIISKILPFDAKLAHEGHNCLVHAMCRHWSLLSLSPKRAALVIEHLTDFFTELRDFLEDSDKPHEIAVPVSLDVTVAASASSDPGEPENESTSQQSRQTKTKREISPSETFPCLSSESCSLYFDTLLKLVVASIAIFSVKDEVLLSRSSGWAVHPFAPLENYFELSGALVSLLTDSSGPLANTLSSSITHSLKMLLDIAAEQIHQCINWRFTVPQLSPEEIAAGKYDPAAKSMLKDLVESYRIEVVAPLEQLCENKFIDQKLTALQRKVEKACEYVSHLSTEFELGEIKMTYSEDSDTDVKPRAKRQKTESAQPPFDSSTWEDSEKQRQDLLGNDVTRDSRKRCGVGRPRESGSIYSEEEGSMAHQSDTSSSGDFGVSGDWGQNELANESDDSSRQLGEVTVTH